MNRLFILIAFLLISVTASISVDYWVFNDNGAQYGEVYAPAQGDGFAAKLVPDSPGYILELRVYCGQGPGGWIGFDFWIVEWDGVYEQPKPLSTGTNLGTYIGDTQGWLSVDITDYPWNTSDPFVILVRNRYAAPEVDTVFYDSNGQSGSSVNWKYFSGSWQAFTESGDLMIRAKMNDVGIESSSLGTIKAVFK